MPEAEPNTDATLRELMGGPAPQDDRVPGTVDDEGLLEDDDYLLVPPRRWNKLTVVLVAALIFLVGFIVGVIAARLTSGFR
jgi:hypothetical protein